MEAARSCSQWPLYVLFNKRVNTVQESPSSHSLSGPSKFIVRHMKSSYRKSFNLKDKMANFSRRDLGATFRGKFKLLYSELPRNVLKHSRAISNIIQPRGRSTMKQENKNSKMESRNSKNAASEYGRNYSHNIPPLLYESPGRKEAIRARRVITANVVVHDKQRSLFWGQRIFLIVRGLRRNFLSIPWVSERWEAQLEVI